MKEVYYRCKGFDTPVNLEIYEKIVINMANIDLEESVKKLISTFNMKFGKQEKRIEAIDIVLLGAMQKIEELEKRESLVVHAPQDTTAWYPNKKFLSWYEGTFAPSEDDKEEEVPILETEEIIEPMEDVTDEVLEVTEDLPIVELPTAAKAAAILTLIENATEEEEEDA